MIIFSKKEKAGNQRRIFHKDTVRQAFWRALPIMGSYLFVSMSYGLLMQEAGWKWGWSLLVSMTVYTGAFQFVLITFLSSGASLLTIALTALFMNSRQFFYGLSFVEEFRQMGKRYPYMVHTMTDETYAANCALQMQQEQRAKESDQKMGQNEKKAVPEEDEISMQRIVWIESMTTRSGFSFPSRRTSLSKRIIPSSDGVPPTPAFISFTLLFFPYFPANAFQNRYA